MINCTVSGNPAEGGSDPSQDPSPGAGRGGGIYNSSSNVGQLVTLAITLNRAVDGNQTGQVAAVVEGVAAAGEEPAQDRPVCCWSIQGDGLGEVGNGLAVVPQKVVGGAPVVVGLGVVGAQGQGLA